MTGYTAYAAYAAYAAVDHTNALLSARIIIPSSLAD